MLVREGADGPAIRHRVSVLRDEFAPTIIAVRAPPGVAPGAAVEPPTLARRITGKMAGLYATHVGYPARHYDPNAPVEEARRKLLPHAPPLSSLPDYRVVDAPSVNSAETAAAIRGASIDVLLPSAGIIRPIVLDAVRVACLNVHHGWLPEIRGLWSALHAIAENRPDWIGVSVHVMDAGIDTGMIAARARPRFATTDTHDVLYVRLDFLGAELLTMTLRAMALGASPAIENAAASGVYRSRPTFAVQLRAALREQRFFRAHGRGDAASLAPADVRREAHVEGIVA